jgi:hypothetical protein
MATLPVAGLTSVIGFPVRVDGHHFTVPLPDGNRLYPRSTWQDNADCWHAETGRSKVLLSEFRARGTNCTVLAYLQRSQSGDGWVELEDAFSDDVDSGGLAEPASEGGGVSTYEDEEDGADGERLVRPPSSPKTRFDVLITCSGAKAYRRYAPMAAGYEDDFGQEVATAQYESRKVLIQTAIAWAAGIILCSLLCFWLRMLAALLMERRKRMHLRRQQQALV